MKYSNDYFDAYENYDEINSLCGEDDYSAFGRSFVRSYGMEACYDTYTGRSDDNYYDWN